MERISIVVMGRESSRNRGLKVEIINEDIFFVFNCQPVS
jgi:hypothetical protein